MAAPKAGGPWELRSHSAVNATHRWGGLSLTTSSFLGFTSSKLPTFVCSAILVGVREGCSAEPMAGSHNELEQSSFLMCGGERRCLGEEALLSCVKYERALSPKVI